MYLQLFISFDLKIAFENIFSHYESKCIRALPLFLLKKQKQKTKKRKQKVLIAPKIMIIIVITIINDSATVRPPRGIGGDLLHDTGAGSSWLKPLVKANPPSRSHAPCRQNREERASD